MASTTPIDLGSVGSLWRYPVKSMMGEQLSAAAVMEHGLLGDRAYALVDSSDGKIASAKNPRKWPSLFAFRAAFLKPSGSRAQVPPVRITLPDGTIVTSEQSDLNQVLSRALNRQVTLAVTERGQAAGVPSSGPASSTAKAEEYWPDMEGLDHRDTVTDFALPIGTFFDCATVHLLTSATLNRLRDFYPQGRFEVPRFRPNILASTEEHGVIPMKRRNLITLSILSCFIVALVGCNARPDLESERNLKTRHEEPGPSLLSFVDMHTYALVFGDPTTRTKAMIDLKTLPGWPGPAPEHTLLLPDGKKVLVTYMASATEPVGIAVIKINSINWAAGTADVQVVKNLETDKAGSRSTFPPVTQTSPDQYINKKVDDDWSRPVFAQLHGPTLLPHSRFAYFTMWTDDRIVAVDVEADKLLTSQRFGNASNHLHGVYFNGSGTLGLGVGYFYDESNLTVFRPNRQTGALELLGEIHLGTADRYAPFIHNAFWLDERFAIAGTMQFGPTSLTPVQASIIGPSIWLVDTRTMKTSKIIGTAKDVDDPGVLRSASWITVAGNKLFVAEEDSLDASYANDGFVSVFDFSNREHPKFIKRLRPGRELPADFSVAHSLSTLVDEKSVVVESYTSSYVLKIDTGTLAVSEIANSKEGFKMPHGAWIAGRKN